MLRSNLFLIVLSLGLAGCQKLQPEAINTAEYPNLEKLMSDQISLLGKSKTRKQVSLDGKSEFRSMEMDSLKWVEEFRFLKEMNPSQPEYQGAFNITNSNGKTLLTLKDGEKGAIKKVTYGERDGALESFQIEFHEDKDIFIHNRDVSLNFTKGALQSIEVSGYQKIMYKDTVKFQISLEVIPEKR